MLYKTTQKRVPYYRYLIVIPIYIVISIISMSFYLFYIKNPQSNSLITKILLIKLFLSFLFYSCVIMTLYSHYLTMITSNEIPVKQFNINQTESKINNISICNKCHNIRPYRAHHCSVCDVCIRKMDHHCPWVVNCVGEANQKSFALFIFYSVISSFISTICLYPEFSYIISHQSEINQSVVITSIKQQIVISLYYSLPILGFVISITCLIILVSLGVSQINWLKYNMTMIEWKMYPKKYECPFFEDNIWKHLNIIFGKTWIQKLTPSPIQDSSIYDNDYDEGEKLL